MPIEKIASTPALLTPSEKPENCSKKKIIVITAIVILALAAMVVGLLIVFASEIQSLTGLGAMSHISWPLGAALLAFGTLVLITLVIVSVYQYQSRKKAALPITEKPHISAQPDTPPAELAKDVKLPDDGPAPTQPKTQIPKAPKILTGAEILTLPLASMKTLDFFGARDVFQKVTCIEETALEDAPILDGSSFDIKSLTLGDLRKIKGDHLADVSKVAAIVPSFCLGMLRTPQLEELLIKGNGKLTSKDLELLFPTEYRHQSAYTKKRLEALKPQTLTGHLKQLNCEQLRLLPIPYFSSPEFPWDKIKTFQNVEILFPIESKDDEKEKTRQILQSLEISVIQDLSPALTAQHLPLFSQAQLCDSGFPWSTFMTKSGIGGAMRKIPLAVFNTQYIPWLQLDKKNSKELRHLFDTSENKQEKTRKILDQLFPYKTSFQHLRDIGMIEARHLKLLSAQQQGELMYGGFKFIS